MDSNQLSSHRFVNDHYNRGKDQATAEVNI